MPTPRDPRLGLAIQDLAGYRRALKQVNAELPKMLRAALKEAAKGAEFRAVKKWAQRYRSRRGKTVDSIKIRATETSVALAFGGPSFPYAKGQEFGSNKFRQFFPYTGPGPEGRGSEGRFIFPAVREEAPELEDELVESFNKIARVAYPEP